MGVRYFLHSYRGGLPLPVCYKNLYDKSIVGYRYAPQMPARLVLETIRGAMKHSKAEGKLILDSDNGFQYVSIPYYNLTKSYGITPSMSSSGCSYDNACAESFFSLLKNEGIYRVRPKTIQAAAELVDEYIHFYNYERLQHRRHHNQKSKI